VSRPSCSSFQVIVTLKYSYLSVFKVICSVIISYRIRMTRLKVFSILLVLSFTFSILKQHEKRWQDLQTCRQTKEMVVGRCKRRERDLLALPRRTLRLVIGILSGHVELNRHLSIMGLSKDPFCEYCSEATESASHFLCYCNKFFSIRNLIWGKPCLHPEDIDNATFIKKSHRFPQVLNCN